MPIENEEFLILKNLIKDLTGQVIDIRKSEEKIMKRLKIIGAVGALAVGIGAVITWRIMEKV